MAEGVRGQIEIIKMKVEKKKSKSIDKLIEQKVDGKKVKGGTNIAGNEHGTMINGSIRKGVAGNEHGGKFSEGNSSINPNHFNVPLGDL